MTDSKEAEHRSHHSERTVSHARKLPSTHLSEFLDAYFKKADLDLFIPSAEWLEKRGWPIHIKFKTRSFPALIIDSMIVAHPDNNSSTLLEFTSKYEPTEHDKILLRENNATQIHFKQRMIYYKGVFYLYVDRIALKFDNEIKHALCMDIEESLKGKSSSRDSLKHLRELCSRRVNEFMKS